MRGRVRVVLALLQPEDLLELGDLLVRHDRRVVGVAHVEQLAAQREDAVVVAADDRQAGDGEGLGRVALGNDERALVAVLAARLVGVVELGDAREPLVRVRVGVRVRVRVGVGVRVGVRVGIRVGIRVGLGVRVGVGLRVGIAPTCFFAPSVFLSSLLCLFCAKLKMDSSTPQSRTWVRVRDRVRAEVRARVRARGRRSRGPA